MRREPRFASHHHVLPFGWRSVDGIRCQMPTEKEKEVCTNKAKPTRVRSGGPTQTHGSSSSSNDNGKSNSDNGKSNSDNGKSNSMASKHHRTADVIVDVAVGDAVIPIHEHKELLDTEAEPKPESALKSFLSGGVGGVCVVLVGHPLDLIKVRMQTGGGAGGASVLGLLGQTFRAEGAAGLYRGVAAPLTAVTPMFAVSFWGYDMGQRLVRRLDSTRSTHQSASAGDLSLAQKCVAGGISALPTTVLMAPSERIKCLLQTAKPGQYQSMADCAKQVYKAGGIPSLYRGTALTLLRDVPGSICWFGTYEAVKIGMMQWMGMTDPSQLSPMAVLSAGGFAGMACWTASIPADVLKSRFQSAPDGTYTGGMDVFKRLMKEEGVGALFTGIRPALIRAFPANAACFFGMEVSRKLLAFMD